MAKKCILTNTIPPPWGMNGRVKEALKNGVPVMPCVSPHVDTNFATSYSFLLFILLFEVSLFSFLFYIKLKAVHYECHVSPS